MTFRIRPFHVGILASIAAALLVVLMPDGWLEGGRELYFDRLTQLVSAPVSPAVVVVDIDRKSYAAMPDQAWQRADTARLDYALREAYHAADARPVAREALQDPRLLDAQLTLAPATRLVASPYPVHAIWRANTEPGAPPARGGAEAVLVTRPDWDPKPVVIPAAAARFVAATLKGQSFDQALAAAGDSLDLAALLTLLIETKSITRIEVPA